MPVTDVSSSALAAVEQEHPAVRSVPTTEALLERPLDVFAPCALGGVLDDRVAAALTAKVVCGAANNQLAHPGVDKALADRGVVYAPDFVVNSGGLIQVADELHGFSFERAEARTARIYDSTLHVFRAAEEEGLPPAEAASRLAERRIAEVGRLRAIRL